MNSRTDSLMIDYANFGLMLHQRSYRDASIVNKCNVINYFENATTLITTKSHKWYYKQTGQS